MWTTTLVVVTLIGVIASLAYVMAAGRKLEGSLSSAHDEQTERLRRIERDLDRVRQALDSVSTGVMTIDIRQRLKRHG